MSENTFFENDDIPESEKLRIRAEELYRQQISADLNAKKEQPKNKVWEFINSSFGIWFFSTCIVGLITFLYSQHQERIQQANEKIEAQARKEERQKEEAQENAHRNASMVTLLLPYLTSEDEKEWRIAIEVTRYLKQNSQLPPELESALEGIVLTPSQSVTQAAEFNEKRKAAATVLDAVTTSSQQLSVPEGTLPPRVYIQIASESQRAVAERLESHLNKNNFLAPGIENVSKKANCPDSTEVRYFQQDEKDEATRLVRLIQSITTCKKTPQLITPRGNSRPRHYEVWFSRKSNP